MNWATERAITELGKMLGADEVVLAWTELGNEITLRVTKFGRVGIAHIPARELELVGAYADSLAEHVAKAIHEARAGEYRFDEYFAVGRCEDDVLLDVTEREFLRGRRVTSVALNATDYRNILKLLGTPYRVRDSVVDAPATGRCQNCGARNQPSVCSYCTKPVASGRSIEAFTIQGVGGLCSLIPTVGQVRGSFRVATVPVQP